MTMTIEPDEIADLADKGEDVSRFFTNTGAMIREPARYICCDCGERFELAKPTWSAYCPLCYNQTATTMRGLYLIWVNHALWADIGRKELIDRIPA